MTPLPDTADRLDRLAFSLEGAAYDHRVPSHLTKGLVLNIQKAGGGRGVDATKVPPIQPTREEIDPHPDCSGQHGYVWVGMIPSQPVLDSLMDKSGDKPGASATADAADDDEDGTGDAITVQTDKTPDKTQDKNSTPKKPRKKAESIGPKDRRSKWSAATSKDEELKLVPYDPNALRVVINLNKPNKLLAFKLCNLDSATSLCQSVSVPVNFVFFFRKFRDDDAKSDAKRKKALQDIIQNMAKDHAKDDKADKTVDKAGKTDKADKKRNDGPDIQPSASPITPMASTPIRQVPASTTSPDTVQASVSPLKKRQGGGVRAGTATTANEQDNISNTSTTDVTALPQVPALMSPTLQNILRLTDSDVFTSQAPTGTPAVNDNTVMAIPSPVNGLGFQDAAPPPAPRFTPINTVPAQQQLDNFGGPRQTPPPSAPLGSVIDAAVTGQQQHHRMGSSSRFAPIPASRQTQQPPQQLPANGFRVPTANMGVLPPVSPISEHSADLGSGVHMGGNGLREKRDASHLGMPPPLLHQTGPQGMGNDMAGPSPSKRQNVGGLAAQGAGHMNFQTAEFAPMPQNQMQKQPAHHHSQHQQQLPAPHHHQQNHPGSKTVTWNQPLANVLNPTPPPGANNGPPVPRFGLTLRVIALATSLEQEHKFGALKQGVAILDGIQRDDLQPNKDGLLSVCLHAPRMELSVPRVKKLFKEYTAMFPEFRHDLDVQTFGFMLNGLQVADMTIPYAEIRQFAYSFSRAFSDRRRDDPVFAQRLARYEIPNDDLLALVAVARDEASSLVDGRLRPADDPNEHGQAEEDEEEEEEEEENEVIHIRDGDDVDMEDEEEEDGQSLGEQ